VHIALIHFMPHTRYITQKHVSDPVMLGVLEGYRQQYGVPHLSTAANFDQYAFVYTLSRMLWPTKG